MRNEYGLSDYLKSNCRSWEQDCDNLEDTQTLANHLQSTFPDITYEKAFQEAKDWTGYEPKEEEVEPEEKVVINLMSTRLIELMNMMIDGFDLHFNEAKVQKMSKQELLTQIQWYNKWARTIVNKVNEKVQP